MAIFSNQATLTYSGGTTNSNVVTGEILDALSISKTAVGDTYRPGDTVSYVVSLVNSGAVTLSGITLTDDLGAYPFGMGTVTPLTYVDGSLLYYVNGVLQGTPTVNAGPPLSVSGISVPAGGNTTVVYSALLNEFAPIGAGGTVTNTVTATCTGLTEPTVAEETVNVVEEAVLSISKALSPTTVPENGVITYSFLISNTGNSEAVATDDVTVTDTFNPVLNDITVTLNGVTLTLGVDYTYDETTGVFQTTPGRITVPAATVTQDPATGAYTTLPGTVLLTVTGTV
ncbi:MAG: DUF11 domain-containing protein [Ruminococcaceae bacterium]|nr:DUF11 domain-containing protein [Oscillospiraceae bacterium]